MDPSSIRYCHKGFSRIHEELDCKDIEFILSSQRTKYVVFHENSFNILFHDHNYLLGKSDVEQCLQTAIAQLHDEEKITFFGFLGDAALCLVKTEQDLADFINFYNCEYAEFDRLSEITGFCYTLTKFHWYQQYCCRCRMRLTYLGRNRVYKYCPNCKIEVFPELQPSIICMITCRDKVLLCHRRNNIYTHISGFVEIVETVEQALFRELGEEIGLTREKIVRVKELDLTQPWPSRYCALMIPYVIELAEEYEPELTDEIKDFKWVDKRAFEEAANRSDRKEETEWIVADRQTVARYMLEEFFSGMNLFE